MGVRRRICYLELISVFLTIASLLNDKCIFAKSLTEAKRPGKTQHVDIDGKHLSEVPPSEERIVAKENDDALNTLENDSAPLEEELSIVHYGVSFVEYHTTQRTEEIKTKIRRSADYAHIYPQLPSAPTWSQSNYNPNGPNYPNQNPQNPNSYHSGNHNSFNYNQTAHSNQFYPNSYNQTGTQYPGYNQPSNVYPPYNPNTPYQPYKPNDGSNRYNTLAPGNFNSRNCSHPYGSSNPALCPPTNNFNQQRPGQPNYNPNINPSFPPPHNWHGQQGATSLNNPSYNNTYGQRPAQYNYTGGPSYNTPHSNFNPSGINTNYPYNSPNGTNSFNSFGTQNFYSTPSYGQNPYQRPYNGSVNNYGQHNPSQPTGPYSPYNVNGYNQNGPQNYNPGHTPLAPYPPNSNFSNSKPFNPVDTVYPQNSNNPHHRY